MGQGTLRGSGRARSLGPVASSAKDAPRHQDLPVRQVSAPRPILVTGSTSLVDYVGDDTPGPCPGPGYPYRLHHSGQGGRSLPLSPQRGKGGLPYSPQSGTLPWIPPRGGSKEAKQGILVRFILSPRRTRRLVALTRATSLLPCLRTESKALRLVRRTFLASMRGMYTVPALAVLGQGPEGP